MLSNLDTSWLVFAITAVAVLAFVLGTAIDGMLGEDSFGATGNMIVITLGFFLAVICANRMGVRLNDLKLAVPTGLGGAFVMLMVLVLLKAATRRL